LQVTGSSLRQAVGCEAMAINASLYKRLAPDDGAPPGEAEIMAECRLRVREPGNQDLPVAGGGIEICRRASDVCPCPGVEHP
jgi:hypothetical protein